MSWIRFHEMGTSKSGLTKWWTVNNFDTGSEVGMVRWFSNWRKYAFFPKPNVATVFEEKCLRDIAAFCESETKKHKVRA